MLFKIVFCPFIDTDRISMIICSFSIYERLQEVILTDRSLSKHLLVYLGFFGGIFHVLQLFLWVRNYASERKTIFVVVGGGVFLVLGGLRFQFVVVWFLSAWRHLHLRYGYLRGCYLAIVLIFMLFPSLRRNKGNISSESFFAFICEIQVVDETVLL